MQRFEDIYASTYASTKAPEDKGPNLKELAQKANQFLGDDLFLEYLKAKVKDSLKFSVSTGVRVQRTEAEINKLMDSIFLRTGNPARQFLLHPSGILILEVFGDGGYKKPVPFAELDELKKQVADAEQRQRALIGAGRQAVKKDSPRSSVQQQPAVAQSVEEKIVGKILDFASSRQSPYGYLNIKPDELQDDVKRNHDLIQKKFSEKRAIIQQQEHKSTTVLDLLAEVYFWFEDSLKLGAGKIAFDYLEKEMGYSEDAFRKKGQHYPLSKLAKLMSDRFKADHGDCSLFTSRLKELASQLGQELGADPSQTVQKLLKLDLHPETREYLKLVWSFDSDKGQLSICFRFKKYDRARNHYFSADEISQLEKYLGMAPLDPKHEQQWRALVTAFQTYAEPQPASVFAGLFGPSATAKLEAPAAPVFDEKQQKKWQSFCCPYSIVVMRDPVTGSDGDAYERRLLVEHLKSAAPRGKKGMILENTSASLLKGQFSAEALREQIHEFVLTFPECAKEFYEVHPDAIHKPQVSLGELDFAKQFKEKYKQYLKGDRFEFPDGVYVAFSK